MYHSQMPGNTDLSFITIFFKTMEKNPNQILSNHKVKREMHGNHKIMRFSTEIFLDFFHTMTQSIKKYTLGSTTLHRGHP